MGLFDFFRLKPEKRHNQNDTFISQAMGMNANSGAIVDENSALNFSAVWACIRVISEAIASLPIQVYRDRDGSKEIAKDNPIYKLVAWDPNYYMTSYTWRECLMTNLLIHGNSYFIIERNNQQRPIGLHYLDPDKVEPKKVDGRVYYEIEGYSDPILPENMLHFMGLSYDGCKGKSVLSAQADTIGLSLGANITATSYFGNSSQIFGVLKHPGKLNEESVARLKQSWNTQYSGPYNSNKTAVLEEGMDFKPITIPAADRQLLESRRFQVEEIARIFRVPPYLIGDLQKANYNSMEQLSIDFVRHTLRPYLVNIESELNRKLFRESERGQFYIKLKVEGLLRGDSQSRATFYRELLSMGVLSINEVREMEDLNKIEDGDKHLVPLNFTDIENLNNMQNEE